MSRCSRSTTTARASTITRSWWPRDRAIARRAAALRAEHKSLRLPDAMSLATAIMTDSTLLTLDKKMRKLALRAEPRAH